MTKALKKVMLIYPPITRPKDFSAKVVRVSMFFPLGIAYLAAALEKAGGYEIKILDALLEGDITKDIYIEGGQKIRYGLTDEDIAEMIRRFSPDVIGVSCLFSAMQPDALNICRIAKAVRNDTVTVLGGAHASAVPTAMMERCRELDFVVIGEGDKSFIDLLATLRDGGDLSALDGIVYRDAGRMVLLPKTRYIEDLDSLPFPARHLFPMDRYLTNASAHSIYRKSPYTQMITSRGCPFKCSFCALENHWGSRQRVRSAKSVLDELELLVKRYGVREIHFEDDNLTADKKRAAEIFDGIIERGLDISWNVPSGIAVASFDEELLDKMKASGCYSISLAIESGNQDVLSKLMNKPVNLKRVPGLVRKIREAGLESRGFFILGYPGETKETMKETVDFARGLELDWAVFFIASPIPGTKMFSICVEKGYIKESDFDPVRCFYKSIIKQPEFTSEYVAELKEEAIIDVNFRNNPNLLKYDIDKAIQSFKDVVAHYPHFDFANFYLGEAYLKKGDTKKAISSYRDTLKTNRAYAPARRRLSELGAAECCAENKRV
jgi:magnesium-protoporphyrin IX monomethyl ester (oxidative) cyclase